jgi:hypothetical protein
MSYALQKVKPKHQKVNLLLIIKLRKKMKVAISYLAIFKMYTMEYMLNKTYNMHANKVIAKFLDKSILKF